MSDLGDLCGCECDPDAGNNCSLYEEKIRKARKDHVCCECGKAIRKGTQYHYVKGCWEGQFDEYKTHIGCNNLRVQLCASFGDLNRTVAECLNDDVPWG